MSEVRDIESYLANTQQPEDHIVMEARLLLNPDLRKTLFWQKQTYSLIQHYSRKQIRAEICTVHKKMFSEKKHESFKNKILSIFKTDL